MPVQRSSLALLLLLAVIWGSSWIANSMLGTVAGPLHLAVLRYSFAFLLLSVCFVVQVAFRSLLRCGVGKARVQSADFASPAATREADSTPTFARVRAPKSSGQQRSSWYGNNFVLGCTMFALPEILILAAAEHGASAFIPLIYAALPLGLSLAAGALRRPAILALGAMLVLLNGSLSFAPSKLAWAVLIVLAVALQGWSLLYARTHLQKIATVRGCMVQTSTAALILAIALRLWAEPAVPALRTWPAPTLAALCGLAALGIAGAYPLYYRLLARMQPEQLASSTWLQTLIAVGEGAAILHQQPSWTMVAAALVLLGCGAMLMQGVREGEADLRLLPDPQP